MKLRYYILLCACVIMASCEKKLAVKDAPDFMVTTEASSYKVGEPVTFNIQGSADVISFYSGEIYHDYMFSQGRAVDVAGKGLTLSFKNGVAPGNPPGTQTDQFSVLLSTDFGGDYTDLASVKAATWIDITDSFTLATTATLVPTDTVNLSQFAASGKPVYFALRYINRPQIANGFAMQWLVENFTLSSVDAQVNGVPVVIRDQIHAGFRVIDEYPEDAPSRSQVTTTRVTLYGPVYKDPNDPIFDPNNPVFDPKNPMYNPDSAAYVPGAVPPVYVPYDPGSPYNDPLSESWAVSGPVSLDSLTLGNDRAVAVRSSVYATKPTTYSYTYQTPGTYKAYFVASNNTIDASKKVVREVDITITP